MFFPLFVLASIQWFFFFIIASNNHPINSLYTHPINHFRLYMLSNITRSFFRMLLKSFYGCSPIGVSLPNLFCLFLFSFLIHNDFVCVLQIVAQSMQEINISRVQRFGIHCSFTVHVKGPEGPEVRGAGGGYTLHSKKWVGIVGYELIWTTSPSL